ncbi:hypothetical protein IMZ31_19215 (plasmid) [Pontibacillus sp. ALD_SL1]|uniref:hypothetical protein n=1 Tax=Pontibacillus sp. ALD_SL1 TaxID=2777185 RepID=UPI001A96F60A|nr:hypothetical protein [Pontibacillus sp. ALD_SL1]QST02681.1 hypothetical protein IMZ31_19215 [Pontibacillus sp. ALD_SL1]
MTRVKFAGYTCYVEHGTYQNGRKAIRLIDAEDSIPVATATVNVPEVDFSCYLDGDVSDVTAIKNYGGNEGMLKVLMEAGVVQPLQAHVPTGYVKVPLVRVIESFGE